MNQSLDIEIPAIVSQAIEKTIELKQKVTARNVFKHVPTDTVPYASVQVYVQAYKSEQKLKNHKGRELSAPKALELISAILNSDNPSIDDIKSVVSEYFARFQDEN